MPTNETKLRVLLSSPSDLNEERGIVSNLIDEMNKTWGAQNLASIELLTWENNVPPGFGSEAQDVINKGLGEFWDIYLGLMHTRFGSPTQGFGSGTEEEFEKAYAIWESDKNGRRLMFYFKTSAIDPDVIDLEQLQKVREFKASISKRGGLYGAFSDAASLSGLLRVNLSKVLSELLSQYRQLSVVEKNEKALINKHDTTVTDIERGMLDYFEGMQQESVQFKPIFDEHNAIMNGLAELMREETSKVKDATAAQDYDALRKIVTRISSGFVDGARRLSGVRTKYAECSRSFFESMTKFLSLNLAKASDDDRKILEANIKHALEAMEVLWKASINAQKIIDGWPNVAMELNRARLTLKTEMKAFNEVVNYTANQLRELLTMI